MALLSIAAGNVATLTPAPAPARSPSSAPFVCPTVSLSVTALQRACTTQASACTTCAAALASQYGPLARASSGAAQPTRDEVQSCVFSLVVQLLPEVPLLPAVLACALPSHAAALSPVNAWTGAPGPDFHIDSTVPAPQVASLAGPRPQATPQATPQAARAPVPSAYAPPPPAQSSSALALRPRGLAGVMFTVLVVSLFSC
jgi:hypothetical protein